MLIYWPSWSWPFYVAWDLVKQTYNDLPGPWWLKALLVGICLAIPGPQDELLLLAVVAIARKIRSRREAK